MSEWGYSIVTYDRATMARASGRELRVSPKAAIEICAAIRGMMLEEAKKYLRDVIAKRVAVPYRRYKKKLPHRRGLGGAGRYPVKAASKILEVLESAEANAEYKGLDTEKLKIIHASAYPGAKIRRYMPRAFGRATPKFETLCHVEIVLQEVK
ncbi:MAG: 50S ribosomal protein L22 [Candidatus Bathyarchaeia archaeon]|nr:50S ribosomal protein L22 [Candidatus Bathyarchaeota archaeon]